MKFCTIHCHLNWKLEHIYWLEHMSWSWSVECKKRLIPMNSNIDKTTSHAVAMLSTRHFSSSMRSYRYSNLKHTKSLSSFHELVTNVTCYNTVILLWISSIHTNIKSTLLVWDICELRYLTEVWSTPCVSQNGTELGVHNADITLEHCCQSGSCIYNIIIYVNQLK